METMKVNKAMKNGIWMAACALLVFLSASSCDKENNEMRVGRQLELTPDEQQLVRHGNAAAFDLFRSATATLGANENSMLSPLSLSAALAMTANGAKGPTQGAIYDALGLRGADPEGVNAYFQKLAAGLPAVDPTAVLDMANSIWYRRGFTVLPEFLDTNRAYYKATVEALDFADAGAPGRINSWVDEHTRGKIPTIVQQIPDDMVMYLINAVYFKGLWKQPFDPAQTTQRTFTLPGQQALQTDFMRQEGSFSMYRGDIADAIELPYGEGRYSMVVVKPKAGRSPADVIAQLATHATAWDEWMAGMRVGRANVHLPKFTFSYERTLNNDLIEQGMGVAFSDQADFTGINPDGNLLISEVKQKTFVEVNEEGTEAAAVTSVGVGVTSVPVVTEFDVNVPFLFLIRESGSGLIVFVGQVNDPSVTDTKG